MPLRHPRRMARKDSNLKRSNASKGKADLDPRLVELVRHLARMAARRDYERLTREGTSPPDQGEYR